MSFSKASRPGRPGAYVNWEAQQTPSFQPSPGAIVATPATSDWGPLGVPTLCASYPEFRAIYGTSDTPLQRAARQAFQGEDILGRGGAGYVLAHRFGGSAAAKATKALGNVTPATPALTLSAKYEGTRGNALRVTVQDNATSSLNTDLIILDGTVELERYTFLDADINGARDLINANSDWVTAVANINGVALAVVTSQAFTGGNDGTTVTSGDWTTVMSTVSTVPFGILAPYDLTDSTIIAALKSWSQGLNASGTRFMTIVGGAAGESVATAITRSGTLNDPNFLNLGVGSVIDATYGSLSTAQLVPRIAGILAARGERASLTMARLGGITSVVGAANPTDIDKARVGGVLVLATDSYIDAPVHIEKSVTTYTTTTDSKVPYSIFSNPKFMRTMHGIETDAKLLGTTPGFLGELPVNDKTRNWAVGEMTRLLAARVTAEVVQPGFTVGVDTDPPPSDDDEFIALRIGVKFSRTADQFYLTATVG